jgi:hypothetical protein
LLKDDYPEVRKRYGPEEKDEGGRMKDEVKASTALLSSFILPL